MQAYVKRNWPHCVSAHSGPWQFSKPSWSCVSEAAQLWKHTVWHSGVNVPTTPTLAPWLSVVANSVQSGARSVSVSPAKQMALVRGMISLRVYQCIDVTTPMGGGGGGGCQIVASTAPCGGGGGKACADSHTTPSASLAPHGFSSAYMNPWIDVSTVETSTHRFSPG